MANLFNLNPSVIAYAIAMQEKLDLNKHKDCEDWPRDDNGHRQGWRGASTDFLIDKLQEEVAELIGAIIDGNSDDAIRREAADVGNIAMMLADVCEALPCGPASSERALSDTLRPRDARVEPPEDGQWLLFRRNGIWQTGRADVHGQMFLVFNEYDFVCDSRNWDDDPYWLPMPPEPEEK